MPIPPAASYISSPLHQQSITTASTLLWFEGQRIWKSLIKHHFCIMISLSSRWMNLEKSCVLNIVSCEHCSWLLASTIVLICRHKMTCFMDFSVPKFLGVQNPGRGEGHQLGGWRWPWDCDHTTKLSRLPRRIIISIWRVFTKILPNNIIKETTKSLVERLQFRRLASSWAEMREAWITKIITSTHERWHLRRL